MAYTDLKDTTEINTFLGGGQTASDPSEVEFSLAGHHITFGDLKQGAPTVDDQIPHLVKPPYALTNGHSQLLPAVLTASSNSHVTAYFDYSGGEADALATCKVSWLDDDRPNHKNCQAGAVGQQDKTAALAVIYSYTTSTPVALTDENGKTLTLLQGAKAHVANLPPRGHKGGYKEYLWLIDDADCMATVDPNYSNCKLAPSGSPFFPASVSANLTILNVTSPECTNSQFP